MCLREDFFFFFFLYYQAYSDLSVACAHKLYMNVITTKRQIWRHRFCKYNKFDMYRSRGLLLH
jgi:hypothetical protein